MTRPAQVLIVDDDPDFAALYRELLERQGLQVVVAQTAEAATRALEETGASLDVVLLDQKLKGPGGPDSGLELIGRVSALAPFAKTIVVTGYATPETIERAREMAGQMVVLPSARSSAEAWTLDCAAAELHRALLGLEEYVAAVREGLPRERCAARYYERTTFPMSQETAATWRSPTRRRQRMFVAGKHGEQYFDMHVKPGNLTRVHIWVPHADGQTAPIIYVGHCGRHLD